MIIGSALFIALWATQTASAWYDPSTGRWLTRDPIGEPGFQTSQAAHVAAGVSASPGRWISRDPIGELGGLNLYAYVGNNPLNNVNPSGLATDEALNARASRRMNEFPAPPPPSDAIDVARGSINSMAWSLFMWNPALWLPSPKCNIFVGQCISACPNRPNPRIKDQTTGKLRYPVAREWADPRVTIPGYGPPHQNPQPGDVVTDSEHIGFMDSNGYIEAPSRWYAGVTLLPFNNPLWNPGFGRTPLSK